MKVAESDLFLRQRMQAVEDISPGPFEEITFPLPLAQATHSSHSGVTPDIHVVTRYNTLFFQTDATRC